jgi:ABC-type uncharacterized transport system substrate-binding protein
MDRSQQSPSPAGAPSPTGENTLGRDLLRHFGPGLLLIAAAAAVLLFSDPRRNRETRQEDRPKKVALVNYVSVPVLEDGEAGLIAGLAEGGFIDGRNVELKRYNAEGDRSTAVLIAKEVAGGDFDAILSLSTPMLQAVASANMNSRRTHVFTLSTDPWGAGVGISRDDPSQHPPYMTGQGTMQPVEKVFDLAREANPQLKKVGVVWNPAESNSEASTVLARKVCQKLGIELLEATVDSSSGVLDAVKSLLGRGIQAIWAGGDSTVAAGLDTLIGTARDAGVPVFTNMPCDVKQGAIFALGADYFEVGRSSGQLAARILKGTDPSEVPVENVVPEQLAINLVALKHFKSDWKFGSDWKTRAKLVVDETGIHEEQRQTKIPPASPEPGRMYRVAMVYFAPNDISEAALRGVQDKLRERGFVSGRNVEYRITHAQGDMALIPTLMQNLDQSDADLIVSLTTPCLTSAATTIRNKPVVFTEVYDPLAAGAGTSATEHLPHITGVGSFPPLNDMIDAMQAVTPKLKRIGIVYNSSEANSRKAVSVARELVQKRGLQLEEATVGSTSEVYQAAQALLLKEIDVLWEIGDNTVNQGLEAMIKAGMEAGVPVVNCDAESASRGALVGVGISFYESGVAAGDLAARVLLGEDPGTIPFVELAVVQRGVNLETAKKLKRTIPEEFLGKCSLFHGVASRWGRPAKVAFVQLADGPALDDATRGIFEGLAAAGLKNETDIAIQTFNAQGELSQLSQIFDAIKTNSTDLIITSTTPAMISAAHSTTSTPIVFTVASEPSAVGVVPSGERQPNLVGVYDDPPIAQLMDLAERHMGKLTTVGTIWNPAEPNSAISAKRLQTVCQERGIKLIERHAAATNELRDVTSAICQTGIEILVISADNVTSSGFPAIYSVTREQKIPVYCTEPDLVRQGAAAAVGANFYDWGRQSARLAAQVLAGRAPLEIPLEKLAGIRTVTAEP